jgi:hypothetical protein
LDERDNRESQEKRKEDAVGVKVIVMYEIKVSENKWTR